MNHYVCGYGNSNRYVRYHYAISHCSALDVDRDGQLRAEL